MSHRMFLSLSICFLLIATSVASLFFVASAQEVDLIGKMISIASENGGARRIEELNSLKQKLDALPKPERGNRRAAQVENEKGLEVLKDKQYEQAKQHFLAAQKIDPSNVEIVNNLGFVYLKLSDFQNALLALAQTIRLSPGRSNAWVNLAEIFALNDKPQEAVACYALTFHFSQNRDKTKRYFQEQVSVAADPRVRQAIAQVLQLSFVQESGSSSPKIALEDFLVTPKSPPESTVAPPSTPPTNTAAPVPVQTVTNAPSASTPTPEAAKQVDGVHPCDQAAGHPADPSLPSQPGLGVDDNALDAPKAITLCQNAIAAYPNVPRFKFQLGRAYLKADRFEESVEQFVAAAEQTHGGALAYLADLHLDGAPGIESNPNLALSLYQKASEAGFAPAKAVLEQFEDRTQQFSQAESEEEAQAQQSVEGQSQIASQAVNDVNTPMSADGFNNPEIILPIYEGNFDSVPFGERYTKLYLLDMAENIAAICGAHFTRREVNDMKDIFDREQADLSNPAANIMGAFGTLTDMMTNPFELAQKSSQAQKDQERRPQEAMDDASFIIKREQCGSERLNRFSLNLKGFIRNEGAPIVSMRDTFNICMQQAVSINRNNRQMFCTCFVGKMPVTRVTRAQRKALTTDFWTTAQTMMRDDYVFRNCYRNY